LVSYASDLEACVATSFKLTLPSVLFRKATETIVVSLKTLLRPPSFAACLLYFGIRSGMREKVRSMKSSYATRTTKSGVSGEAKLVAQTMLATSVAFLDALSAFLSTFYVELTNDERKTSGTEAPSLACRIVQPMFEDIAVHRCLASFVDFMNGMKQ
jgi:hypothetical protein